MKSGTRKKADLRLKRIAGQVEGIQRMLGEDRYCVDVLVQIAAVRAALDAVGKLILASHVETCVAEAFSSKRPGERKKKIDELLDVFSRFSSLAVR